MKKILFILSILLLSGCTVDYNVYFTKDLAREDVTLNNVTDEAFPVVAYINDSGASEETIEVEGIEYYDITQNSNSINYKYSFPFTRYTESTGVNSCYKKVLIYEIADNEYNMSTSNYNSCMNFYKNIDQINVNLHFNDDFIIKEHNADQVIDNTYTWVINLENYDNKSINLTYSFNKSVDKPIESQTKESNHNIIIMIAGFTAFIVLMVLILKFKKRSF